MTSLTVTNVSPTRSIPLDLTWGIEIGTYTHYCILENSTLKAACVWLSGVLPAQYTDSAADGPLALSVYLKNDFGTSEVVTSNSVTIDRTPPNLASLSITNSDPTNTTTFGLTYGAITNIPYAEYCIQVNNTSVAACTWIAGTPPSSLVVGGADGSKAISTWLRDAAGNTSSSVTSAAVTLDRGIPTVTISSPVASSYINSTTVASFTVTGTCSEDTRNVVITGSATATVSCSSGNWTSNLNFTAASEGAVTINVNHTDAAGNTATQASRTFNKDVTPPVAALTSPSGTYRGGDSLTLTLSASDALSGMATFTLRYAADGVTFSDVVVLANTATSYAWTIPSDSVATAKVRIVGVDVAGNSTTITSTAFAIDSTAPTSPAIVLASANPTSSTAATFTVASCTDRTKVYISESAATPAFNAVGWQTCSTVAAAITATLSAGDGTKTLYAFAQDAVGNVSTSTSLTVDLIVPTIGHQGWDTVKALGPSVPAAQATDLPTSGATTTVTWPAVTTSSGTIASYNVYRQASPGVENYSTPLQTGISATTRTFTDTTVVAGTTYYYNIAPVVYGSRVPPTAIADSEIKIVIPKDNMALLHRWAVNKEMCTLMGKTIDRNNNYRCAFTGPGGDGTYLDFGFSLFVDRYEQGCNYTYSSSVNKCGSANGCIGNVSPNTVVTGNIGDIYYSRSNATCYYNTNGATAWQTAATTSGVARATMGSAAPGLPPFVKISPLNAKDICGGQTVSGFAGAKRMLRRREHVAANSWSANLTDAQINTLEAGANVNTTNVCNSNYASPQGNTSTDISATQPTIAFDNSTYPGLTNRDTLPACLNLDCAASTSTRIRSLRTGSLATTACESRYGIRDLNGNVNEWTSDQILCNGTTCAGAATGANTLDSTNNEIAGVNFDNVQGIANSGGSYIFTSGRIQLPLGIAIIGAGFTGDGIVSWSAAQFHGDATYINQTIGQPALRNNVSGGGYNIATETGRWFFNFLYTPTSTLDFFGFRCALQAD